MRESEQSVLYGCQHTLGLPTIDCFRLPLGETQHIWKPELTFQ